MGSWAVPAMRVAFALSLALVALPALAQKPERTPPALGPDFSQMLAEITPGLPGYPMPVVADVSVPPLLPIPGPELQIDLGGHYGVVEMPAAASGPASPESLADILARPWLVNVNTAPVELLSEVPLIGRLRAEALVNFRETIGQFGQPADVSQVFGISGELYARLAGHLVCQGETTFEGRHAQSATGGS
jgi:hypothetical protein